MPSDDYSSVASGPLKLKGAAGVAKKKKKKAQNRTKTTTDLEKNLSTGGDSKEATTTDPTKDAPDRSPGGGEEENSAVVYKPRTSDSDPHATETERRFAEAKRKRLKELTESGRIRPELLKTHKQRVEELNAHLARLSEHHDMPKIGPG
ncbi:DUF1754-domain-containing protein [Parathielavia hyrcaniae]|uniref:DUF1754-domain-containing protein n=1 Tax=Parathielavia hyrcaniae TaxID=113614 RepID=A0AAN6T5L3_9PEZI|nr:DUF1754-domain-containing protein [Parathielavia hyrcaniae]